MADPGVAPYRWPVLCWTTGVAIFRRRRAPSREAARASFAVDVRLLPTEEGGRESPVSDRYRPQLNIGQRRRDGEPIEWDCEWTVNGSIAPGENGSVVVRLFGLHDSTLQEDEYLEFYEGSRRVATGHVVAVQRDKRTDGAGRGDPLVFVMRDAFEGVPITSVFHEADGDWQFITGEPLPETATLSHLSHVLALDPTLQELAEMPLGMWAHRHGRDEPWVVEPDPERPEG